jgi:bifunctional DNase/RNase
VAENHNAHEEPDTSAIIPMTVRQVILDPRNQTPIVILVSEDEKLCLPIWIGPYEATSIIMALEEVELPRPMTHDLVVDMLEALDTRVEYVVIHEVKNGTFFAEIVLLKEGERSSIDARPSDSIAIALRADAPILAERAVCDAMERVDQFMKDAQTEQYKTFLENLDPGDISKYKM